MDPCPKVGILLPTPCDVAVPTRILCPFAGCRGSSCVSVLLLVNHEYVGIVLVSFDKVFNAMSGGIRS